MKKHFARILIMTTLLTLTGCGSRISFPEGQAITEYRYTPTEYQEETTENMQMPTECSHIWIPATFDSPGKCRLCGLIWEDKLTPAPEWGFNYLYEMEYCLVDITSYNLTDANNSYIVATGLCTRFENGYMVRQSFTVENGKCVFGTSGNPKRYAVVNNDILDINNGYDSFCISERKTISGRNNFVCFVKPGGMFDFEQWFVPYSLIDWDRGAEVISSTEYEQEIKLYLIN